MLPVTVAIIARLMPVVLSIIVFAPLVADGLQEAVLVLGGLLLTVAVSIWSASRTYVQLIDDEVVVKNLGRTRRIRPDPIVSIETRQPWWLKGLSQDYVVLASGKRIRVDSSVR